MADSTIPEGMTKITVNIPISINEILESDAAEEGYDRSTLIRKILKIYAGCSK